ncbi:MAG: hypothetical protein M3Y91_12370 [Actinomycetota bacterium]|nr:hypothetical protein [Actinomycetota bacterium]
MDVSGAGDPGADDPARALADGIDGVVAPWVVRCVTSIMTAWRGECPPDVAAAAAQAGAEARADVTPRIRALLDADIDEQRSTPLAIVRAAVRYPTAVLAGAGCPEVERDDFAVRAFPADVYDLSPASLAEVADGLAELGIVWGATKAFEHKRRHRAPGGPPG